MVKVFNDLCDEICSPENMQENVFKTKCITMSHAFQGVSSLFKNTDYYDQILDVFEDLYFRILDHANKTPSMIIH